MRSEVVTINMKSKTDEKGKQLTVNQEGKLAGKMRGSRKVPDEAYLNVFPIAQHKL